MKTFISAVVTLLGRGQQKVASWLLPSALLGLFLFISTPAHAQSLGGMMCSIAFNMAPFEKLFNGIAYIAGAIAIGSGLFHFVRHQDGRFHHEHPLHRGLWQMVAGACLLALPAFIRLAVNSIFNFSFGADLGGGLAACLPLPGAGGPGLDGLMMNLVEDIRLPIQFMLSVLCILIGIFLIIRGLIKATRYGTDHRTNSIWPILVSIVIGTILYTVGTSLDAVMSSVFGDAGIWGSGGVRAAIMYDFGFGTIHFQNAVVAALTFFQMIGMIAFIRGWLILKDAAEGHGQKTVSQGLTHIIGGVCAINIYRMLEAFDASFGTGFIL